MNAAVCIICFVPFSEELEVVRLKCGHCFHRGCINEWFRIRNTCPQCRTDLNPEEMHKVILSFEINETLRFDDERSEWDEILIESQGARIIDLEQQMKSKDLIIEESLSQNGTSVQELLNEIKSKDTIITRTLNDKEKLEELLLDLTRKLKTKENLPEKIEKLNIDIQEIHTENRKLRATLDQISFFASSNVVQLNYNSDDEPEPDYELS